MEEEMFDWEEVLSSIIDEEHTIDDYDDGITGTFIRTEGVEDFFYNED